MSDTETRSTRALKKTINEQSETIGNLRNRVSTLADEIADLQHQLGRFKTQVASDIKDIIEHMNK